MASGMTTRPGKAGVTKIPAKPGTTNGRQSSPSKLFAEKNGRASNKESLLPNQMTSTTPGDQLSRSMSQYGKGHDAYLPDDTSASVPVRNVGGGIRSRPRSGRLEGQFQRTPEVPF